MSATVARGSQPVPAGGAGDQQQREHAAEPQDRRLRGQPQPREAVGVHVEAEPGERRGEHDQREHAEGAEQQPAHARPARGGGDHRRASAPRPRAAARSPRARTRRRSGRRCAGRSRGRRRAWMSWSATKAAKRATSAISGTVDSVRPSLRARGRQRLDGAARGPPTAARRRRRSRRPRSRCARAGRSTAWSGTSSPSRCAKAASAVANSGTNTASSTTAMPAPVTPAAAAAAPTTAGDQLEPAVEPRDASDPGRDRPPGRAAGRRQRAERGGEDQRRPDDPARRPHGGDGRQRRGQQPEGDRPTRRADGRRRRAARSRRA